MSAGIVSRGTARKAVALGSVAGCLAFAATPGQTLRAEPPADAAALMRMLAQPASEPAPLMQMVAQSPSDVARLMQMLAQRDRVIMELARRVEELERRIGPDHATPPASAANGPIGGAPTPAAKPGSPTPQLVAEERDPDPPEDESNAARPPGRAPGSAPGAIEVDEEAIDRALERTLVETGALLLPFGKVEVQPSLTFERTEGDFPVVVVQNGGQAIGEQEIRRNEFTGALALRAGLPLDAQLELGVPYRWVDQSRVTSVGGTPADDRDSTGTAFGDISVGLAKTLLRENGWWPDVVGRVRWDAGTGERTDEDVALGGGFDQLEGQLVASKRQDPLVFVGSVSYQTAFEDDGFDPGDEFGMSLGAVLAASPETSLRFLLNQRFGDEFTIDGQAVDGSDTAAATLSIGASSIVARGVLLDIAAGVGLTDDAPDYSISVALPVRFDLPLVD